MFLADYLIKIVSFVYCYFKLRKYIEIPVIIKMNKISWYVKCNLLTGIFNHMEPSVFSYHII